MFGVVCGAVHSIDGCQFALQSGGRSKWVGFGCHGDFTHCEVLRGSV